MERGQLRSRPRGQNRGNVAHPPSYAVFGVTPGIPISGREFEDIVTTCRNLDRQERADRLVRLTLKV
jgi:hypothetical protein